MSRPRSVLLLASALLLPGALASPAQAAAPPPTCAVAWGSLPESSAHTTTDALVGVRAGRHTCFDRLVVDVRSAGSPGYDVRYVTAVRQEGSGALVPLRGGAALQVVVRAPSYDDRGQATYVPPSPTEVVGVSGFRTFRQVAWAGSFEGQTTLGVGVRARLPFRVFVLPGSPSDHHARVVVDVAHHW